jgi:hypothetical protein
LSHLISKMANALFNFLSDKYVSGEASLDNFEAYLSFCESNDALPRAPFTVYSAVGHDFFGVIHHILERPSKLFHRVGHKGVKRRRFLGRFQKYKLILVKKWTEPIFSRIMIFVRKSLSSNIDLP